MLKRARGRSVLQGLIAAALAASSGAAKAGPALLYDPQDDQILYAEDIDQSWHPASITKLMTAYVVFDAVKAGKVGWGDNLPLSPNARGQPATRIGLRGGIAITVEQGVRGMILRSANDFSMALAELVGGSEDGFAQLMNATALRLGMTRSRFKNPHGLPDPEQVTTARDMAMLAKALLRDHPDRADVFSNPQVLIHRQVMHSGNDLLRTLEGANGMKTGFTCGSGYNIVATATREGHTLIAVVMGEPTRMARSERTAALIEHGFQRYTWKKALPVVHLASQVLEPAAATTPYDLSGSVRIRKCAGPVKGGRLVVVAKPEVVTEAEGSPGDEAAPNGAPAAATGPAPAKAQAKQQARKPSPVRDITGKESEDTEE